MHCSHLPFPPGWPCEELSPGFGTVRTASTGEMANGEAAARGRARVRSRSRPRGGARSERPVLRPYLFSRLGEKRLESGFLISAARNVDGFRFSAGPVYRFGTAAPKQP